MKALRLRMEVIKFEYIRFNKCVSTKDRRCLTKDLYWWNKMLIFLLHDSDIL